MKIEKYKDVRGSELREGDLVKVITWGKDTTGRVVYDDKRKCLMIYVAGVAFGYSHVYANDYHRNVVPASVDGDGFPPTEQEVMI